MNADIPTLLPIPHRGQNPYTELLYRHLQDHGIRIFDGHERKRPDFVHFHWPHALYAHRNHAVFAAKSLRFFTWLASMRRRGTRVIWTMHNDLPHEAEPRWLHERARAWMVGASDIILVNFAAASKHIEARYGRTQDVVHVPHGSYREYYPRTRDRAEARTRLGLPADAFVYLAFGELRPYKRIPELIRTFAGHGDNDAVLLIAGRAREDGYAATLAALAGSDARIRLSHRRVADDEIQDYFLGSDMLVLAHPAFSSGTAVLALDFGLPLLAPSLHHVEEIAQGAALVAWDPSDPRGLADGLVRARNVDHAQARVDALVSSEKLDWSPIARGLAELLRARGTTKSR